MNYKVVFGLTSIFLLMCIASGFSISSSNVTTSSITWGWDTTAVNISVDGMLVCNTDLSANSFILSDLNAEEQHFITVNTETETKTLYTTTDSIPETSGDKINDLIYQFLFLIISIACAGIAAMKKELHMLGIAGFIFGLIGYTETLGTSFYMGILFAVVIIGNVFVTFGDN